LEAEVMSPEKPMPKGDNEMLYSRYLSAVAVLAMLAGCAQQSTQPSESAMAVDTARVRLCNACHYVDGASAGPEFPNIAGQQEAYLLKAVQNYKRGQRDSETMQLIASLHTEEQLNKFARYFAAKEPAAAPSLKSPDPALWDRGKQIFEQERVYGIACADCHGYDGKGMQWQTTRMKAPRAVPSLAGQRQGYLAEAIQRYVRGEEQQGMCTMRKAGKTLSEKDVKALVVYLSSL
jgi:cytochrome c553